MDTSGASPDEPRPGSRLEHPRTPGRGIAELLPVAKAAAAIALPMAAVTLWPAVYTSWSPAHNLGFSWRALIFALLFVGGSVVWGLLPLRLVPSAAPVWSFGLLLVLGGSIVAAGMTVLSFLVPVTAAEALLILVLAGAGLAFGSASQRHRLFEPLRRVSRLDILVILLSLIAVSAESPSHVFAFSDDHDAVIYAPWSDGFMLARTVGEFSQRSLPRPQGPWSLAGMEPAFYHYAAYLPAAAFSALTATPALTAVDAFAIPWSLFLVAMAAYALGGYWWGSRGAILGVALATVVPDATYYGFRNAWFGYHWLLGTSFSLPWGVAIAGCSIILVHQACRRGDLRLLCLGFVPVLGSVLFKAQVAVLLTPTLLLWTLVSFSGIARRTRLAGAAVLSGGAALAASLASGFEMAPTIALSGDRGTAYLMTLSDMIPDQADHATWVSVARGSWLAPKVLLLTWGAFGVLGLLYVALLTVRGLRKELSDYDFFPLCLLGVHFGFAFGVAGNTNGVPWELHHRPFVLVYLVLAAWCGGAVVALVSSRRTWWNGSGAWLTVFALAIAAAVLLDSSVTASAREQRLLADHLGTRVTKDHLACIDLIREHAVRGDVLQASDNDPGLITSGLTELTPYLGAPQRLARLHRYADVVERRLDELQRLAGAVTEEQFEQAVGALPIRWYLVTPASEVSWPSAVTMSPEFRCGDYRVYDLNKWRN